ncbi:MAG: hypothetical protein EVG15_10850 [Candidatus Acididesulfobacter diazotrophicus]|jgi:hypothetical protein|uniref:Uncharacterized protein n=1 Tax=Candidatus Acididesulfobacter diazotrophicus TaxID=2597226 RepID=A0A519BJQ7_9DELT|nr:MAG: hypothetical protein EVG15_10850 [Candidatus Acididesulfobacter diazotrophicus]
MKARPLIMCICGMLLCSLFFTSNSYSDTYIINKNFITIGRYKYVINPHTCEWSEWKIKSLSKLSLYAYSKYALSLYVMTNKQYLEYSMTGDIKNVLFKKVDAYYPTIGRIYHYFNPGTYYFGVCDDYPIATTINGRWPLQRPVKALFKVFQNF